MRIGAVITIAADHDARNAASRPTMPVPGEAARPGSRPAAAMKRRRPATSRPQGSRP